MQARHEPIRLTEQRKKLSRHLNDRHFGQHIWKNKWRFTNGDLSRPKGGDTQIAWRNHHAWKGKDAEDMLDSDWRGDRVRKKSIVMTQHINS